MTAGNSDIQKLIELGSKAEMEWETTIRGEKVTIKWSPIKEWESSNALASAFDDVSKPLMDWLLADKKERKKLEKKGYEADKDEIRDFNRRYAIRAIYYAMKPFYPDMKKEDVTKLDINFNRFHNLIMEASGDKGGREAVQSFPGK